MSDRLDIDPHDAVRAMSEDATEELFRVLLETAEVTPLPILGDIFLALATVVSRRLHALPQEVRDQEGAPER